MALQHADYAYILSSSRIVNEGEGKVLREDDEMIKSYFKSEYPSTSSHFECLRTLSMSLRHYTERVEYL